MMHQGREWLWETMTFWLALVLGTLIKLGFQVRALVEEMEGAIWRWMEETQSVSEGRLQS